MARTTKTAAAPAKRTRATPKAAAAPAKRTRRMKAIPLAITPEVTAIIKRGRGRPRKPRPEVEEPKRPRGRPSMDPAAKKRPVPLRLAPEVHDWFMANESEEGWRKDIENLLAKHMRRKSKA